MINVSPTQKIKKETNKKKTKKKQNGKQLQSYKKATTSETSFDDTFGTIPDSFYVSGRNLFYLPKRYWTKMTKKEKLLKTTEFRHKILYIYYTYILTYEYNND